MKENNNLDKVNKQAHISWYPGHMAKTKKEIIEDLKLIDIVLEIIDARAPMSSRNEDLEKYIKDKEKILVLNKSDLSDDIQNKKWIQYFEKNEIDSILFNGQNGKNTNGLLKMINDKYEIIKEKYEKKGRIGRNVRCMVIGIPNVGKSSIINRLSKRKIARAENRPGVTVSKQWIKITDGIELLDTPGMMVPKIDSERKLEVLSMINAINEKVLDEEDLAFNLLKILMKNYPKNLEKRYNIVVLSNVEITGEDVLKLRDNIAKKVGAISRGNSIDEKRVSHIIINDFRTGKLGKITLDEI